MARVVAVVLRRQVMLPKHLACVVAASGDSPRLQGNAQCSQGRLEEAVPVARLDRHYTRNLGWA